MKEVLWTAAEASAATQGRGQGTWSCTGVSIDNRHLDQGDLFIALKGPNSDGHDYVKAALAGGASAAMVSHIPEGCSLSDPLLIVKDTVRGLEDLGRAARLRTDARVIAVTGSVGKTGVKEALSEILSRQGKTHATAGNLNNHFGLPLTLARMPKDCDYAVLELGMNHAGELRGLSEMAQPHVGLITTVAAAHLENFANVEAISDAKCEIFEGLVEGGVAVLNGDNAFYTGMKTSAQDQGVERCLSFGRAEAADFKVLSFKPAPCGGSFIRAEIKGDVFDYTLIHSGEHWVMNSLGVLAGVYGLGADIKKAAAHMAHLSQLKGRGARHHLNVKGQSIDVIDESYNANDASMRAALSVLGAQKGRRIAILGDMLELGVEEVSIHKKLVSALDPIDLIFTCGPLMKNLYDGVAHDKRGAHEMTSEKLAPLVVQAVRTGDVLSIKSSRGSRTDLVLDALLDLHLEGNRD